MYLLRRGNRTSYKQNFYQKVLKLNIALKLPSVHMQGDLSNPNLLMNAVIKNKLSSNLGKTHITFDRDFFKNQTPPFYRCIQNKKSQLHSVILKQNCSNVQKYIHQYIIVHTTITRLAVTMLTESKFRSLFQLTKKSRFLSL